MTFEDKIIQKTVDNLLKGKDYRHEIINTINAKFFDFSISFFKDIVDAKLSDKDLNIDWYNAYFINNNKYSSEEIAIYSGINKKTINNIYGNTSKSIVIDVANDNYKYLKDLILNLEDDYKNELNIEIKLVHNNVSVNLNLTESLLVLNALATKKIAIRGGAWSSIGKKVEKPLMIKLCELCNLDKTYYNASNFVKDKNKSVDREIDFVIYNRDKHELKCEVKLMGKGNPESADAVIARASNIFVADTLSQQNKNQLEQNNIKWLELKDHSQQDIISKFKTILKELSVPIKE